ncbi:MAG TPA: glycoside hydrolase family 78 protein [Tepidisphaeraceae bacterium]|nr:glycoside hydrolase family 78 protein [Tepidisphaeraceae bacterium]
MHKLILMTALMLAASAMAQMKPTNLRCEYLTNPIGIDTPQPRLSWMLESNRRGEVQTAYQIVMTGDGGELWDSGKVSSNQTTQIEYAGKPLQSRQRATWKVRVWDRDGKVSESEPASWEMGLLAPSGWKAKWIGSGQESGSAAPMFRKTFDAKAQITRARLYICGLGYHDVSINGQRIGDHQLDPGYTNYAKRMLYVTHDVTREINSGANAIGVILGSGWYDVHTKAVWNFHEAPWRDRPKLLLQLAIDYADGSTQTIASDESWKWSTGPITYESIYSGEHYDARLEKTGWDQPSFSEDDSWKPVVVAQAPKGKLVAQQMPPIRFVTELKPKQIAEPKPGVYVIDMGQNFSGVPVITAQAPAGTTVKLRCAERTSKDGMIDTADIDVFVKKDHPEQTFQEDHYTFKGTGATETWHPRFTYHGYQYVEVTGFPGKPTLDNLRGLVMHTDIEPAGTFECSNPLLNKIASAASWAYLSNLMSIPTDCPHREKNGWTGDAHLACEQGLYTFNGASVYTKWIDDIQDAMHDDGDLPGIIPTGGWGYTLGPAWDSALLLIPHYLYEYNGDTRILVSHYPAMKKYVDFLTSRAPEHIVKGAPLGDWAPFDSKTNTDYLTSAYYFRDAQIVSQIAKMIGNEGAATKYANLAEQIKAAINKTFFDPKTGNYAEGTQTAQACALVFDLVPSGEESRVFDNLIKAIDKRKNHLDCGILGAKWIMQALLDHGRADVGYAIATQTDLPSWGHWIEQGATTLWENWDGSASRNHIMYGDVVAWFFKALAGIQPDPAKNVPGTFLAAPGFSHFIIRPNIVGDLTHARGEHRTMHGMILSDWTREGSKLRLQIKVPPNTTATLSLPTTDPKSVQEGGKPADQAEGVTAKGSAQGRTVYELQSGDYGFECRIN